MSLVDQMMADAASGRLSVCVTPVLGGTEPSHTERLISKLERGRFIECHTVKTVRLPAEPDNHFGPLPERDVVVKYYRSL